MTRVLPDPAAGQDQQRAVDVGDGLALGGGQVGEQVHRGGPSLGRAGIVGATVDAV